MNEKLFYAIAVDEQLLLQQSEESGDLGGVVQLDEGDFLVFDEVGVLSCCKKSDFCEYFVHVDGRGSYVYKQMKEYNCKDNDSDADSNDSSKSDVYNGRPNGNGPNKCISSGTLSTISNDEDIKVIYPHDAESLLLNSDNSSKWIQRATILAFPLRNNICLEKIIRGTGNVNKYEGGVGDVLVIHISGFIEMIASENIFNEYYRFVRSDDSGNEIQVTIDDITGSNTSSYLCDELLRVSNERLRIAMDDCMDPFSCSQLWGDKSTSATEHHLEVKRLHPVLAKEMTKSFETISQNGFTQVGQSSDFLIQFLSSMEANPVAEENETLLQFCLSSNQIHALYEQVEKDIRNFKCWEGIVEKRATSMKGEWKFVHAVLYPDRLVVRKDVPVENENNCDTHIKGVGSIQTFRLAYCSVNEITVDGKTCLQLNNVKKNAELEHTQALEPYSDNKASGTGGTTTWKFLASLVSSSHIQICTVNPSLEVFTEMINSATLFARRDMAFDAAQNGNCPRVVEIISSLSSDHAISLLRSQCPVGSSSGILIQHQAAQTCSDLLKVLFPVDEQSPTTLPPSIISELDILDYSLSGLNTLHYAARANNMEVVKYLLQHKQFGLSCDTVSQDGKTALHLARSGEMVGFLLDNGASLVATDDDGNTPLMSLLSSGMNGSVTTYLNYVDGLRQNGDTRANIDVNMESWKTGLSSLSCAIRAMNANTLEIVERLVTIGADPNITDLKCNSCLHEAVLAYITLSRGLMFSEESARDLCAVCVKVMKALVCYGADVTVVNDKEQSPFLLLCSEPGCYTLGSEIEEIVNVLTSSSEESGDENKMLDRFLNCRGKDGWYPLHHVIRARNSILLECLAEKGANVNVKSLNGNTPLDFVHDAIDCVRASVVSEDVLGNMQGLLQCLSVLNKYKAWRRHRRDQEVEADKSDIKFATSTSHLGVGIYEVRSATLPVIIQRLCNELYYDDNDAEAVALYFKYWECSRCTEVLNLVRLYYPSPCDSITQESDDNVDNNDNVSEARSSEHLSRCSMFSRSRKGSGFFDAKENSPGGLLLFLKTWFERSPTSLGTSSELSFFKLLDFYHVICRYYRLMRRTFCSGLARASC